MRLGFGSGHDLGLESRGENPSPGKGRNDVVFKMEIPTAMRTNPKGIESRKRNCLFLKDS